MNCMFEINYSTYIMAHIICFMVYDFKILNLSNKNLLNLWFNGHKHVWRGLFDIIWPIVLSVLMRLV